MKLAMFFVGMSAFASMSAQAVLVSAAPPTCSVTNTTINATACSGSWAGNDSNQQVDVLAQLSSLSGGSLFTMVGKSDGSGNGPFTSNPKVTSGTLTFDSPLSGSFAIALKASNSFSLYYFSGTSNLASLGFSTIGTALNKQGKAQDLSHATLYSAQPIPEPETYALMLAGLGVMGFIARRRQSV